MATGIFRPTVTSNAATGVADQLRAAILSGALTGGSKIREVEVAEQTGVSRGPVREALRMLSDEGLVVLRHNRGAVVAGITPDDAVEIYAVRGALAVIAFKAVVAAGLHEQTETSIAQKLADIRDEQLEALRRMEPGDSMTFLRAEFDFQNALVGVAGLDRVTARFTQLTTELCVLIAALEIEYPDIDAAYVKYDLLLQALQDGQFAAAELHWRNHITQASIEVVQGMPGGPEALAERPWMLSVI